MDIQISKFTSSILDVVVLYRSQQANFTDLNEKIKRIITNGKPQLIIGDFNFCYLGAQSNTTRKYLMKKNFSQLINEPTHIEGNMLDQAYLTDIDGTLQCTASIQSNYYTDHKGLAITVKKGMIKLF